MKPSIQTSRLIGAMILVLLSFSVMAQQVPLQFFRPNDKRGLNMFETTKADTIPFTGFKLRIGGGFAQDFQALSHSNTASFVDANNDNINDNQLIKLSNGFNLAMANLTLDAQLEDGIRMNITAYLSSRHHEETWVKGGYIQFDKLPFLHSDAIDNIMKSLTIKVGDYELDYGDAHYRRADGGNEIFNPFVENYIMDEFATEVGGEVYYHPFGSALIAMGGISSGILNGSVTQPTTKDSATGKQTVRNPAFHGKLGFDKQLNQDLRVRITGSFYTVHNTTSNTLFFGDRTGSHYFLVMENSQATPVNQAWSGRFNPLFSASVSTFMINPFVKFHGLEFFGTAEFANGRLATEKTNRNDIQYAGDLIYRFPKKENFWVGVRYNTLSAELPTGADPTSININRFAASAGWFLTKNIMLKTEYVTQQYKNFPGTDIRNGGKFNGVMIEAAVSF